jgi:hypothetical protein
MRVPGHLIKDGYFDRRDYFPIDEEDYEPSALVDLTYSSEWTGLTTVEQACVYAERLWHMLSENEKAYVAALYLGKDTAGHEAAIVVDMMRDKDTLAAQLEDDRARDVSKLGDLPDVDVSDPPFKLLDERLAVLQRHLDSIAGRPSTIVPDPSTPAVSAQSGGAASDKLYRLMALADSLHDFGKRNVDKAGIMAATGAEIPVNLQAVAQASEEHVKRATRTNTLARTRGHHNFRYGESTAALEFIADEAAFINFLNDTEFLHFRGEEPLRHDMFGIDLLRQFDKAAAFKDYMGLYWLAYLRQRDDPAEALKADIWALPQTMILQGTVPDKPPPKNHKDIVFLSQVIHTVHKIKAAFGDGDLVFIMDNTDNQLHRMVLGSATLYTGIGRMLIVIGWKDELMATVAKRPTPRDKWSVRVCDANLLDGNTHFREADLQEYYPDPGVSATATGDVFRDGLGHVCLGGVVENLGDPEFPEVTVTVGTEATRTYAHYEQPFTITAMETGVRDNLQAGRTNGAEAYLARKRACDWGQVRHCAVMNDAVPSVRHIFVSPEDRMACLYSVYDNIDTIFIKCNKDSNTGWPPFMDVLQTTFTLRPRRQQIQTAGRSSSSTAGTRTWPSIAQAALVAVVVAMSFASGWS